MKHSSQVKPIPKAFESPVFDSQSTFRTLLLANSYPGTVQKIAVHIMPPVGMNVATAAIALTLLDFETKVWLDTTADKDALADYLAFHCGCSISDTSKEVDFALLCDPKGMPSLSQFNSGSSELPDRSATLIIQVPKLSSSQEGFELTGPGIETTTKLQIGGVPEIIWREREDMSELFPMGIDLILTCGVDVVALPRTTRIGR